MGAHPRHTDFDALVALHRHDPQSFDAYRRAMLRAAVEEAPAEHRAALERLLEQIEARRCAAASPQEAAEDAFRMMCESVDRLRDAWEDVRHAAVELQTAIVIERARLPH